MNTTNNKILTLIKKIRSKKKLPNRGEETGRRGSVARLGRRRRRWAAAAAAATAAAAARGAGSGGAGGGVRARLREREKRKGGRGRDKGTCRPSDGRQVATCHL